MAKDKDGLTKKRKLFIKYREDYPDLDDIEILRMAGYNPKSDDVARVMVSRLVKHPVVAMKLQEHAAIFESVIIGTAKDWAKHDKPRQREIALQAAMFGHDKAFGKSTVKIEQQVSVVKVLINLTGDGEEPPEFIEGEAV